MKDIILFRKKFGLPILLLFLIPSIMMLLVVTAWGEETALPPLFSEEDSVLPPFSEENASLPFGFEEENEDDGGGEWSDWEEDWNGSWNGAGDETPSPDWELWKEEDQEQEPDWGPEKDPEEGPAFPEEEPEEKPSSATASSKSSSSDTLKPPKSSSSKSAKKKTAKQGGLEPSDEETPGADFPGVLPRRVTEEDIPRYAPPLWYRGTDPNILWILLVALSLIILGMRILWEQEDNRKRRRKDTSYDDEE